MKNNEWNIPSDYFEKNKKALMPVRKFPTGKWLLALAAACVIGVGFFMLKGDGRTLEMAQGIEQGKRGEEGVREGKIGEDKRGEEKVREGKNGEDMGAKYLSPERREGKIDNEKQNENGNESFVKREEEKVREGKRKEEIAEGLKEIPREELVAYLLEEDSDLIENID